MYNAVTYVFSILSSEKMVWDDPVFGDRKESHFLTTSEQYSDAMKRAVYFEKFSKEHGIDNPLETLWIRRYGSII